jgi:hypothetical protein
MHTVLRTLCQLTPGRLLLAVWLALFSIAFMQETIPHPVTNSLSLFGMLLLTYGYSIAVVLGLPAHAGAIARGFVRCSLLAFAAFALLFGLGRMAGSEEDPPILVQAIVVLFVFSPTFIATRVLGEARRAAGLYKPTDFIGTWLALHMFAFGGAWWAHRQVRVIVQDAAPSGTPATIWSK